MRASLTILANFAMSARKRASNSSGVLPTGGSGLFEERGVVSDRRDVARSHRDRLPRS